jgi:predicted RNase H-like HicB family nuclease
VERTDGDATALEGVSLAESGRWVVATHDATGVTTHGETRPDALENLEVAVRLYAEPTAEADEPTVASDAPWFEESQ